MKCHIDPQTWIHFLPPTQPSPAITSLNIVTFALSSQAFTRTLDFYRLSKMQICFETWFWTFFIGFHTFSLWVTPDQTCLVYKGGEGTKTGKVNASSRVRLLSCLPQSLCRVKYAFCNYLTCKKLQLLSSLSTGQAGSKSNPNWLYHLSHWMWYNRCREQIQWKWKSCIHQSPCDLNSEDLSLMSSLSDSLTWD